LYYFHYGVNFTENAVVLMANKNWLLAIDIWQLCSIIVLGNGSYSLLLSPQLKANGEESEYKTLKADFPS
jgi:hypothetical protein